MEYYTFATNIISLSNLGILCVEKQQDLNLDIRCSSSMMKIIKKYADVARFLGNRRWNVHLIELNCVGFYDTKVAYDYFCTLLR
jgi:hypothetical protein